MRESQFLINLENTNCLQSPSKTAEIIAPGKLIINISNQIIQIICWAKIFVAGGCVSIFRTI